MNESEITQSLISCQGFIELLIRDIIKDVEAITLKKQLLNILKYNNVDITGKKVKFNRQQGAFVFREKKDNCKRYTYSSLEGWDGEYYKYAFLSHPLPTEVVEFMRV